MSDRRVSILWLALVALTGLAAALLQDMVHPRSAQALVLCVKQTKNPDRPKAFFRARKCPGIAAGQPISTDGRIQQFVLPGAFTCWDKNQNGACDKPDEDTNGDSTCTNADCGGSQCWDLNGNLRCDPDDDRDGNGSCTTDDCKSPECWDLNGNLRCETEEDIDGADGCTIDDCKSPQCWDLNRNLRCEPAENVDGSADGCTIADCKAPECWDLNKNLRCDSGEDKDGRNGCTIDDCKGAECWDLNRNGACDAAENIDQSADGCTVADCKAPECWDLNKNLRCDTGEDRDGVPGCSIADCAGQNGMDGSSGVDGVNGMDGSNGSDGVNGMDGVDGTDGTNGLPCWDLNGDGACSSDENVNGDATCDAADCQGESQSTAAVGEEGPIPDTGTGGLINLSAGNYVLIGKGTLINGTASPIDVTCNLLGDGGTALDTTNVTLLPNVRAATALQAAGRVEQGQVRLRCTGGQVGDVTMSDIVVNAILVGRAVNAICGDGVENRLQETCDDGNTTDGDGCSSTCQDE